MPPRIYDDTPCVVGGGPGMLTLSLVVLLALLVVLVLGTRTLWRLTREWLHPA